MDHQPATLTLLLHTLNEELSDFQRQLDESMDESGFATEERRDQAVDSRTQEEVELGVDMRYVAFFPNH